MSCYECCSSRVCLICITEYYYKINNFLSDGSFGDQLFCAQQSDDEPMDWDELDPTLVEELTTCRCQCHKQSQTFILRTFLREGDFLSGLTPRSEYQAKANSGFGHYEAKPNDVFRFASLCEAKQIFSFLTK